ncbi:hypothetical protein Dda_6689 [Drechslerella dactyloides]|uniref:C2H2-type domain-containing protein n=1 Tax=Drechslerella dactyloides TaxID=74499 RepID=A0AAD6NGF2_DREDA|nr:hypothetical protein Dda_6689 [Drechslerella dactyloides]
MSLKNATSQITGSDGFEGFRKGLLQFQSILTPAQHAAIQNTSLSDLQKAIKDIQTKQFASKTYRYLSRIDPFVQGMIDCGKVIEVFGNTSPMLAYVWGPMKFLLQTASNAIKVFEKLLDSYESIAERLPQFEKYIDVFPENLSIRQIISAILEDILKFHKYAMKIFTRRASSWRLIFESTWNGLKEPLDLILEDLRRHQGLLMEEGLLAHYNETRIHWDEELSERKNQRKRENNRLKEDIRRWAAPTDFQFEHDRQREIIKDYVHTGRWLVTKPAFLDWVDSTSYKTLFWLYGIPGSGKTVLASHVIEHLKATNPATSKNPPGSTPSPTIAYFYCREDSNQPATYDTIIRTLIWQLIHQNPDIMHYFDSERSGYTQVPLRRVEDLQELLRKVTTVLENIYIVVDGVDEIEPNQRGYLLETFLNIDQTHNFHRTSKIKFFLSSQVSVDVRDILAKFENRIGYYIEHLRTQIQSDPECYFAEVCLIYLASSLFESEEPSDAAICNGDYSFSEYALRNLGWHLREIDAKKISSDTSGQLVNRWMSLLDSQFSKTVLKLNPVPFINANDFELPKSLQTMQEEALVLEDACKGKLNRIRMSIENCIAQNTISDDVLPEAYGEMPFKCKYIECPEEFPSAREREEHVGKHELPFKCEQQDCIYASIGFATKGSLEEHMRKRHTNESLQFPQMVNEAITIWNATKMGNISLVKRLLDEKPNLINTTQFGKKTRPIDIAMKTGKKDMIKYLLDSGANAGGRGFETKHTPLYHACRSEDTAIMDLILSHISEDKRTEVCSQTFYWIVASRPANLLALDYLLRNGANPNRGCESGAMRSNALQRAIIEGSLPLVKYLVGHKADTEAIGRMGTALQAACWQNDLDIIKYLIDSGANTNPTGTKSPLENACFRGNIAAVEYLVNHGARVNHKGGGYDLLVMAINSRRLDIASVLFNHGVAADPHDLRQTPLQYVCDSYRARGDLDTVIFLIRHGASVNPQNNGKTPLQRACNRGHRDVIEYLVAHGAEINPQTEYQTPLQIACEGSNVDIVEFLVSHGAIIDTKDKSRTPLQCALLKKSQDIVECLIECGADLNVVNDFETPFQTACRSMNLSAVMYFVSHGADINLRHGDTLTPLQLAYKYNRVEIVKYLIDQGADTEQGEGVYNTALQAACQYSGQKYH